MPEVVTTSGYALLHFFSDAAYNLTGFNIAYSYVHTSFTLPERLSVPGKSKHRPAGGFEVLQRSRNTLGQVKHVEYDSLKYTSVLQQT